LKEKLINDISYHNVLNERYPIKFLILHGRITLQIQNNNLTS